MLNTALKKIKEIRADSRKRKARIVLNSCLQRWGDKDERIVRFIEMFDKWYAQIPDQANGMVLHLLSNFCYYPHRIVNICLVELHQRLIGKGTINQNNTIYIPIKSPDGNSNSSNEYWSEYKLQNKLSKYIVLDDFSELTFGQWEYIKNIVLIDDCGGSGQTLTDYIKSKLDIFTNKNLYFISIHIMKNAQDCIYSFAEKNNININILNTIVQEKAFNHTYFRDNELENLFVKLSEGFGIPKKYIKGFKDSQGLFAFYNNTPNNTLGLFYYNTDKYEAPFPRNNDQKPSWWYLKRGKKIREIQNYNSHLAGYIND